MGLFGPTTTSSARYDEGSEAKNSFHESYFVISDLHALFFVPIGPMWRRPGIHNCELADVRLAYDCGILQGELRAVAPLLLASRRVFMSLYEKMPEGSSRGCRLTGWQALRRMVCGCVDQPRILGVRT